MLERLADPMSAKLEVQEFEKVTFRILNIYIYIYMYTV